MPLTSGTQFAKQGVILVAANYRVGRFGFFAFPVLRQEHPDEPKGNYAYMDQIAALKWVQQNIAAFGGDPNNVTIFGFSAGGVSVHSLLTMPMARGLFHKAIVESGGSRDSVLTARPMSKDGIDPNYPVSAETIGTNFAHSLGIEGTDQAALAKLRALTTEQVLRGGRPNRVVAFRSARFPDSVADCVTASRAFHGSGIALAAPSGWKSKIGSLLGS
jgi:para-nitrobenzyl esterase